MGKVLEKLMVYTGGKFPHIMVLYCVHKSLLPVAILSQMNSVSIKHCVMPSFMYA